MKKLFIVFLISLFLLSCAGIENWFTKAKSGTMKGNFKVTLYSGGQPVKIWDVKNGFISSETQSDGWYFNYNGKLIRISGTVVIEEQ